MNEVFNIIQSTDLLVKNNKAVEYYNVPAAFDIETSSFYDNGNKRAIMYHWQFAFGPLATHGRTWKELDLFLSILSHTLSLNENKRLIVYVHNLAFEFFWMHKRFDFGKVFFIDENKPAYAIDTNNWIEYRCSLKLSGKSLQQVGKDLVKYQIEKKTGDLDHNKIRTPITPLTDKELGYCENDVRVLTSYIQEKIESDGNIIKIPLTLTSYVRNFCRKSCYSDWHKYNQFIHGLTINSTGEYKKLRYAFRGGFTHANVKYIDMLLEKVGSTDISSSYPTRMVLRKFPMSQAKHIVSQLTEREALKILKTKRCIFTLDLYNVVPKYTFESPLSISKCQRSTLEGVVENNGRVFSAKHVRTICTEQDFDTFMKFYDSPGFVISDLFYYDPDYLPLPFVKSILELYEAKTKLKGIADKVIEYTLKKGMLNSAYGMSVTDIIRAILEYSKDAYCRKVAADMAEALTKYNKNIKRFLYYPWGIWVTAFARHQLFLAIEELKDDYVYSDTDSTKYRHPDKHKAYFETFNAKQIEIIKYIAAKRNIPEKMFIPEVGNKQYPIGVWDFEGVYDRFKTLGAKRYLWEKYNQKQKYIDKYGIDNIPDDLVFDEEGNQFQLTVAGANKKFACEYLVRTGHPFESFTKDLIIPAFEIRNGTEIPCSGRSVLTYFNEPASGTVVDYLGNSYEYSEESYIHFENAEYTLTMKPDLLELAEKMRGVQFIEEQIT